MQTDRVAVKLVKVNKAMFPIVSIALSQLCRATALWG